jgi:hypothetical protein
MTTIHIHIDNNDEALAFVAIALNRGYHVSIDLDAIDGTDINLSAKERIKIDRAKADTYIRARDAKNAEREAYFAKQAEKAARRRDREAREVTAVLNGDNNQAAYDARWVEVQRAREVACPSCGADIDHPCITPQGKPYGAFAHRPRYQAAYDKRNGVL